MCEVGSPINDRDILDVSQPEKSDLTNPEPQMGSLAGWRAGV